MIPNAWDKFSSRDPRNPKSILSNTRSDVIAPPQKVEEKLIPDSEHKPRTDESVIDSKINKMILELTETMKLEHHAVKSEHQRVESYIDQEIAKLGERIKELQELYDSQESFDPKLQELQDSVESLGKKIKSLEESNQHPENDDEEITRKLEELRSIVELKMKELDTRDSSIKSLIDRSIKTSSSGLRSDFNEKISQINLTLSSINGKFNTDEIKEELLAQLREHQSYIDTKIEKLQLEGLTDIESKLQFLETELESKTKESRQLFDTAIDSRIEDVTRQIDSKTKEARQELDQIIDSKTKELEHQIESSVEESRHLFDSTIESKIKDLEHQLRSIIDSKLQTRDVETEQKFDLEEILEMKVNSSIQHLKDELGTTIESGGILGLEELKDRLNFVDGTIEKFGTAINHISVEANTKLESMKKEFLTATEQTRVILESHCEGLDAKLGTLRHELLERQEDESRRIREELMKQQETILEAKVESVIRSKLENYIDREYLQDLLYQYLRKERIDHYMSEYAKKTDLLDIVKPIIATEMVKKIPRAESPKEEIGDVSPPPVVKTISKMPAKPRSPAPSRSPK